MSGMHGHPTVKELVEPTAREHDEILDEARRLLKWASSLDAFIDDGRVPPSIDHGGGTYGGVGSARSQAHGRRFVAIYRPSARERETHAAYHGYCREHGYPTGERAGAKGYPPSPVSSGGVWAGLSWTRIRSELRREQEPQQLTLELELA